tara:strand:+ start:5842 stop:6666 length:825 start_codon:yes stop_codon:yes gene_type:complete
MKIIKNTSGFDTGKLRSLFSFIHRQVAKDEGKLSFWKTLNIQVQSKTTSTYSGQAYLGKYRVEKWDMFLSISDEISIGSLSQLFAHELMHNYGYEHHQFPRHPLSKEQLDDIKANFDISDMKKVARAKKRINKVAQRYERMLKRQKAWSKKLKLANTNLAKVEKEIRKYERVHSEEKRTTKYLDPLPVREPKEKIDWEGKVLEWAKENDEFVLDERWWDGCCWTSDRWVSIDGNSPSDYDQLARNKTWQQWWYLLQEGLELKKQGRLHEWSMNY